MWKPIAQGYIGVKDKKKDRGGPKVVEVRFPHLGLSLSLKFYAMRRIRTNDTRDYELVPGNKACFFSESLSKPFQTNPPSPYESSVDTPNSPLTRYKIQLFPITKVKGPHALRLNTGVVNTKRPKLFLAMDTLFEIRVFAMASSGFGMLLGPQKNFFVINPNHHSRDQLAPYDERVPSFSKHTIITTSSGKALAKSMKTASSRRGASGISTRSSQASNSSISTSSTSRVSIKQRLKQGRSEKDVKEQSASTRHAYRDRRHVSISTSSSDLWSQSLQSTSSPPPLVDAYHDSKGGTHSDSEDIDMGYSSEEEKRQGPTFSNSFTPPKSPPKLLVAASDQKPSMLANLVIADNLMDLERLDTVPKELSFRTGGEWYEDKHGSHLTRSKLDSESAVSHLPTTCPSLMNVNSSVLKLRMPSFSNDSHTSFSGTSPFPHGSSPFPRESDLDPDQFGLSRSVSEHYHHTPKFAFDEESMSGLSLQPPTSPPPVLDREFSMGSRSVGLEFLS
jgi:hypothetical protein